MNIRIKNAKILTMDDTDIREGEIWVRGDRITYVGPAAEDEEAHAASSESVIKDEAMMKHEDMMKHDRAGISWDRVIDASGNLIMPGFKNAHTHSGMTFLRSYADDLPLSEWLNKQVFPKEAQLDPDKIYDLSLLAFMEYLTSGITACFDMYLTPDSIAAASEDFGFRTVMVGGMNDFSQSLAEQEEWYHKYHGGNLVSYELGFHAEYTTSKKLLKGLSELAHGLKAPVWAHNSETRDEVAGCMSRHGMSPTQLMDSLGLFDYGGGGYHCIWLSDEDMDIFEGRGLTAVTNPASNLKLASGIAPTVKLLGRGINLAIGTDGPASNNCLDMFREMFLVTGLAKYREKDAAAMDAADVLRMATVGGAKAMNLPDCDVLAAGKKADLIMIDLHRPNMQPENNILKNLVYSGSKENVKLTMIDGKILYEDGSFYTGFEPEKVYSRAAEIIQGMG